MAGPRNDPGDTGCNAYLQADEPWDDTGRPRVWIPEPFWASASEELEYLSAVEETRGMLPSERMEALRRRFGKGAVKPMPRTRQSRRERDAELAKLRSQVDDGEQWWQR